MAAEDVRNLIQELRDETTPSERRAEAAGELGESGHADALAPLLEALWLSYDDIERDDEEGLEIRWAAADALGRLRRVEGLPEMIAYLEERGTDDEVARSVALSLGAIGDPAAVAPLIRVMRSGDPGHRWEAAMRALARFADPHADEAIDALQRLRGRALPHLGPYESAATLRERRVWEESM